MIYFCPTSGEVEDSEHGGFDVCCDSPEEHIEILDAKSQEEMF